MNYSQHSSDESVRPGRIVAAGLLLWMLGVMLLGWFLLDGPGVSSIVKRVVPFKRAQQSLRCVLGEPAEPTLTSDEESQP